MALGEQFTDVLGAARAGAPWALETLYREFHPSVLAFLRGRAPAEAEDLASDVFVAVAEGLARFEGDEDGFRSWLFTIAYRQVGQLRRRAGRRRTDPFPIAEVDERLPPGDAESDAMAAISTQQALDLIATLPPAQAEVLLLRVVADLPVDEVATIVGKRPTAVRALQHRAIVGLARRAVRDESPKEGSVAQEKSESSP
ncbi:MAG: sigma-70 family RNA polymerase sigma factor [Acidimicrobiia bacterium]|nr:sigma-70 family RNA polymerase sigma factor [Acidimicrobiia bacterium]